MSVAETEDWVACYLPCLAIDDSDLRGFIHQVLAAVEWECEIARVVAGKRDVDVDDQGDEPAWYCERPPPVWVPPYAHLVQ